MTVPAVDVPVPAPLARGAAVAALVALIALGLLWELLLAPTGRGTLVLKVVPLALCVPGAWRARVPTFRALSLLVWLYVAEALVRGYADPWPSRALAGLELLLCLLLFAACVSFIRYRPHTA